MNIVDQYSALPVSKVLAELTDSLKSGTGAVLAAPPGAGKTTLVPLVLLEEDWCKKKIILIEPRRLAARAAARRMAAMLGEDVGARVGYRMRLDTRVSDRTRIEVVTEGVFTRMALEDPELSGVDCVLFDEFHERALEADFGLALALDIRSALREDLRIVVMSATLDVDRVAALLGNPAIVKSEGRAFPVEIRHGDRKPGERIESAMVREITRIHDAEHGSILAFLPGQAEIRRTADALEGTFGPKTLIMPLYGALSPAEQDRAIRPAQTGIRKIVLSTPVAESSITIDGVRIVIDSGLVRQPVFEPSTGVSRLETIRASRASVDQRAGRAGRTGPGLAIRLWHPGQTGALAPFTTPQILASDLSGLVLDCATFGVTDPASLNFIDPPPAAALDEARLLLVALGALDERGRLTSKGQRMRDLPLPPRLAGMVASAREDFEGAAEIAVLLSEQGLGGTMIDIDERLTRFRRDATPRAKAARNLARRIAGKHRTDKTPLPAATHLADAFPDRIAMRRGQRGRFLLANGRGAMIDEAERMAGAEFIVVADLTGSAARARILAAAELSGSVLDDVLSRRVSENVECVFDNESLSVQARRTRRIGTIVLSRTPVNATDMDLAKKVFCEGLKQAGIAVLPFSPASRQLRARAGFLNRILGSEWPDISDQALGERLEEWLLPYLGDRLSVRAIDASLVHEALKSLLDHNQQREIDRIAPTHYEAPTGSRIPIRYDGDEPVLSIRVQELFGETRHPTIGGGKIPLLLELLSPAQRPLQTTRDLPGFWRGSWGDVRSEMRGRYPRHPWPDNPEEAAATRRTKPRGT